MDMRDTINKLSMVLQETCIYVEPMGEPDDDGAAWFCEVEKGIFCFVSCEDNKEDIDVPTITIAIPLGDVSNLGKDALLKLLEINGNLWRANLTVQKMDDAMILFIQYKVMAKVFIMDSDEFIGTILHLLNQYQIFSIDQLINNQNLKKFLN